MADTPALTITLTDIAHGGDAIGRDDGRVIFARYGIPGEKVEVQVLRQRRDYAQGRVTRVLDPSPHRTTPPCPYFGVCGGCQWQHIDYPYQLELKRKILKEQLERIGKIDDPYVAPTLPSPDPWHYRNHARFSVDRKGNLGFIQGGDYRHLEIAYCHLMHPEINTTLAALQGKCKGTRQITVRHGIETGDLLIQPSLDSLGIDIESGQDHYYDHLFGYRFKVSSPSFFQVNVRQAERMVGALRDRIAPTGDEVLVDAYGGVGTFALLLAPFFRKVFSIEEAPSAVEDARVNCAPFANIELLKGKTEEVLPELPERPDTVILDPPRVGCHERVLDALLKVYPRRLVYVSCDPATLARDLGILCRRGYTLKEVLPIDMFPQTYHIESIATLEADPSGATNARSIGST